MLIYLEPLENLDISKVCIGIIWESIIQLYRKTELIYWYLCIDVLQA